MDELADVVRIEGARILATLVRNVGDLQLAEDAVQEAVVRALRDWPVTGIPDQPRAWLTVTARRVAVDMIRREQRRPGREQEATRLLAMAGDDLPDTVVRDDQLRLIFTCCHPALALDNQVPLALRTLCGLSPAEIARVLLTSEAAVAKRLTRSRMKIARAAIPYRVPADHELPARLAGVCAVVHAFYTAAHTAPTGQRISDLDACREALRLARCVHELLPDEPMPAGVLALILLTEARRATRTGPDGEIVTLEDADRARWDHDAIAEGLALLDDSLRRTGGIADAYLLEAAIAAEHAVAPNYGDTDWPELVRLYDLLVEVRPTSSARLARAVAVAEADGPDAGLTALDGLATGPRVSAVRSEMLGRAGRHAEAVEAAEAALTDELSEPERRHRARRVAYWRELSRR